MLRVWHLILATLLGLAVAPCGAASAQVDRLTIVVPGAKGGGHDLTAVAIRDALLQAKLVESVSLVHSPGAGGLVALAEFVGRDHADGHTVIVGGRSILGATRFNHSEISLKNVAAIARLNSIALIVAVPPKSPIHDMNDLMEVLRNTPGLVRFVGGSAGSVDEELVYMIAKSLRVKRSQISFTSMPGGGDQVVQELFHDGSVAVSSYEELAPYIKRGQLRAIAVSTEKRIAGSDVATFTEQGIDLSFADWKGVFASSHSDPASLEKLRALFLQLSQSAAWREQLASHGWHDNFAGGPAFSAYVKSEDQALAHQTPLPDEFPALNSNILATLGRPYRWALVAGGLSLLLLLGLIVQRFIGHRKEAHLQSSLIAARDENEKVAAELGKSLSGATEHINAEFARWDLSDAEKDVGWLILKGLSFQEIAEMRGTSERTIRQQARSIYAKSGLAGRSELSAYFLEDFFADYRFSQKLD